MRGKYGVPMNAIECARKKRWCRQCEHGNAQGKNKFFFCTARKKMIDRTKPHMCKHFKKKWQDAKGGEVVSYYINEEV